MIALAPPSAIYQDALHAASLSGVVLGPGGLLVVNVELVSALQGIYQNDPRWTGDTPAVFTYLEMPPAFEPLDPELYTTSRFPYGLHYHLRYRWPHDAPSPEMFDGARVVVQLNALGIERTFTLTA